jgi:phage gpG-like protein
MITEKIEVDDDDVRSLFARLRAAATDLTPLMQDLGEYLTESTKQRFATSIGPSGRAWAPNAQSTYVRLASKHKSSSGADGRINKAGAARVMGKKPLIGETKSLVGTLFYRAWPGFVDIGSPMEYAGVQQRGAKKHSFSGGKTPWADIPARPFLGISDEDAQAIVELGEQHLRDAAVRPK